MAYCFASGIYNSHFHIGEFIEFLKDNKKWWLLPMVLVMLFFGVLLVAGNALGVGGIYSLF